MVFQVIKIEDIQTLLARLRDANTPRAIQVIAVAHNLEQGRITAEVFTDEWPHFSAVVGYIVSPTMTKLCEVFCYATSDSALVSVLTESRLIQYGLTIGLPHYHANPILQAFPELRVTFEGTHYYLPGALRGEEIVCPSGFVLGKLPPSEDNAKLLASHWKYMESVIERIEYIRGSLKCGQTCAIYTSDDTHELVAWGMQYPHGEIGHIYTVPEYRGKGLASVVIRKLCNSVMADRLTPEVLVEVGNPVAGLFLKLGFVESGYKINTFGSQTDST